MTNGTGPLSSRPHTAPSPWVQKPTTTPHQAPTTGNTPSPGQAVFANQDQTGQYQSAPHLSPNQMAFKTPDHAQRLTNLRPFIMQMASNNENQLPAVPPEKQQQFDRLAQELGFKDFHRMQFQLRNIPTKSLDTWLHQISEKGKQTPLSAAAIQTELQALALQEIETLFNSAQTPMPKFEGQGSSQWSPQATLAVYNAFSEIGQSQGSHMLQRLGQNSDGSPLVFSRTNKLYFGAFKGKDNQLSLIEALSGAMMVASRDEHLGKIVLRDGAMSMKPQDILKHPEITDYLDLIAGSKGRPKDQAKAIVSLREMLNYALPDSRKLPLSGKKDVQLQQAIKEFQLTQVLKNAQDILNDTQELTQPKQKIGLQAHLDRLITDLQNQGPNPALRHRAKETLAWLQSKLQQSPASHQRMQDLISKFDTHTNGQFNRQTLEHVVENWFGIIDGGKQLSFDEQVITHELGHVLQMEPEILKNWHQISWRHAHSHDLHHDHKDHQTDIMGETLKPKTQAEFGSAYAEVNAEEDFAESYRLFTQEPKQLLQKSLMKFLFMAALTGAYEGKEEEMANLIKDQGYSRFDLEVKLLELRGHIKTASHNNVHGVIDQTVAYSKRISPLMGLVLEKAEGYFELKDKIADWWVDFRGYNDTAQFTPKMASAFEGMEKILGIDSSTFRNMPAQKGFVLDFLSQNQAIINTPNATPQEKKQAQLNMARFENEGLTIFPAKLRNQIPPLVRQRLSTPKNRKVLLALSQVLGKAKAHTLRHQTPEPGMLDRLKAYVLDTPSAPEPKTYFNQLKANPDLLRQAIDPKLYADLPPAFQVLLQEQDFIKEITLGGESSINANNIYDYTFSEIAHREKQTSWQAVKGNFEGIWELFEMGLLMDTQKAHRQYKSNIQEYNQGTIKKAPTLSLEEFKSALQRAKILADKQTPAPEAKQNKPKASDSDFEEKGLKHFIKELQIPQPQVIPDSRYEVTG